MGEITKALREHAKNLLQSGQAECVIGYEISPRKKTRPVFVYQSEDIEKLAWNNQATFNLTRYLKEILTHLDGHVAIIVKPCDSKALNVLIAEQKIERERVHVIGMTCRGITDASGRLQTRCQSCDLEVPLIYDHLIKAESSTAETLAYRENEMDLDKLEAMSHSEKADFWLSQFDRCIRCYACRQVCPMCDCPTCLYERDDSLWVSAEIGIQEKRAFHLGRAYHLAGRCIGCNECENVCPMNIPISLLNQKLAKELKARFDYQAGMEAALSPLTTVLGEKELSK